MHDFVLCECFEGIENLYKKLNGLLFCDSLVFFQILRKIAFVTILEYKVKIVGSLFDIVQLDDILVVAGPQNFNFVLEQLKKLAYIP